MNFDDCSECGGQCCRGFGIPAEYGFDMYIIGVPLGLYQGDPYGYDAHRYFELHEGITITPDGKRFIINQDVPVTRIETETGTYLNVGSRCTMLNERGRCMIYDSRPDICRNFTEETARFYHVPEGCIYERAEP